MSKYDMEGKVSKGGVNSKPTTPRPDRPPKGWAGRGSVAVELYEEKCETLLLYREILETVAMERIGEAKNWMTCEGRRAFLNNLIDGWLRKAKNDLEVRKCNDC